MGHRSTDSFRPASLRPTRLRPASLRPASLSASQPNPVFLALPLLLASTLQPLPLLAQQQGYGQTINSPQQERELDYGTGPSRSNVLDATNPIDLMNRLRRATAMDDATQPSDAIDAALRDFQAQPTKPSASPGSSLMQGP
jgi:hypothetical protein